MLLIMGSIWVASAVLAVAAGPQKAASPDVPATASPREVVDRYCVSCHNQRLRTGGLALDGLDPTQVAAHAEEWEKVVRKLRMRVMPPVGARRPDEATYEALIALLETALDRSAASRPNPGGPLAHRLNRAEYANAIRDLLTLDVDAAALLPPDDSAYGFDNVSDVLGVSPSLQERYLSAARKISALAIGDPEMAPRASTYRVRQDLSQNQHLEGLPLGTIGGTLANHTFPLDGEYVFQTTLMRTNLGMMRGLKDPEKIAKVAKINAYHAKLFAGFLERLRSTPDGDGSVLDHSMIFFGGGMGNPNQHAVGPLPMVIAGGGIARRNRHLELEPVTPVGNLWLTVANAFDNPLETFGESNGTIDLF
jgi:hypothetical protein